MTPCHNDHNAYIDIANVDMYLKCARVNSFHTMQCGHDRCTLDSH